MMLNARFEGIEFGIKSDDPNIINSFLYTVEGYIEDVLKLSKTLKGEFKAGTRKIVVEGDKKYFKNNFIFHLTKQ